MLKSIHALIESLGLSLQKRAVHIQFSNPALNSQVFIQRIQGQHIINEGLKAELLCLSTNAHIQLKQFIGCQVAVDQVTDLGKLSRTTGIITGASQGQSDGSLTLYKLTLEDATSLWHKRRNSRVFMNKSVLEITEIIFKEWQAKSPLFSASLALVTKNLQNDYDIRPFFMQANETDYDFLTRLWRSEGINWLIDETEKTVAMNVSEIQPHQLKLIDDNSQLEALERRSIRFHRSNATERFDTISSLIAQRHIRSNTIQVQRWQSDTLAQDQGDSSLSTHVHIDQQDNETLSLEQAWTISPAWMADLNGEDQATASSSAQLSKLNTQLGQYQDLQSKYFTAQSSVRDANVGYWFEFVGHPEIDQHEGSDRQFLILSKHFYNQNNLPKDINTQVEALLNLSRWQHFKTEERQANELSLVRRGIPVVPEYDPLKHRPTAYPQRAKVVGPHGETIYVDQWGRIKVRFVFTRADDHGHDGGAGANDNDTDSAWVDVLTSWAGEGYGSRFHPRIGEIVVIDFFDGNVDRPFVVGRLHEAERHQTMFDIKGQLPDTKKLSGIRSAEVGGQGFNQLRFDDTTGQISTQLQSSHAATQLNLGNLSHPKDKESSDGRGEGFELRTDKSGALRTGGGLLLSTYKQLSAQDNVFKIDETINKIKNHQFLNNIHDENLIEHKLLNLKALEKLNNTIEILKSMKNEGNIESFDEAIMLLTSSSEILISSQDNFYVQSGSDFKISAQDDINIISNGNTVVSSDEEIDLLSLNKKIKLVSANDNVEIEAHKKSINLIANEVIKILSVQSNIELNSPTEISLNANGTQIKLNKSGIFLTTTGKFEVKAGQHIFKGGESASLPKLTWSFKDKSGTCMKNASSSHEAFVELED